MVNEVLKRPRRRSRAPVAECRATERLVHGTCLTDDYAWLRADNWREVLRDPSRLPADIARHLEAENAYSEAVLRPTRALQRRLVKEMRGRIREDDSSPPSPWGPWLYLTRYRRGGQHPIHARKPREGGRERILLDGDRLAKGHEYFDFGQVAASPDHRLMGWSADFAGSELHDIRVRDIASGKDLPDLVSGTTGEIVWSAAADAFFYVRLDAEHRPSEVWLHRLGENPAQDRLVHRETDPGVFVHIGQTLSRRFLVISIGDHETSEARIVELARSEEEPRLVAERVKGRLYSIDHHGDRLVIATDADGAEDFKIVEAPITAPQAANWTDIVPHRAGRTILASACLSGHLIRLEREEGLPRLVVRDFGTGEEHAVAFDDEAYALGFDAGLEYETTRIRFTYTSPARPAETYDYDVVTRERTLIKRQSIPSGHDSADYVVKRRFATAPDGELVPVSILHRAGLRQDGSAPCLLYGYGAYGMSMSASFRTAPLSLVDRGFVFAIAHVRGGSDKGRRWYRMGKREAKTNSFTDFIAAARMLADEKLVDPARIVAQGGSAGGLLVGAAVNMAPDVFAGVIAEVPFVDALNTILDDSLPLTPPEWPEWGNPITDKAAFETIRAYSPYDNVSARPYPAMLITGGITDPRVTYWEPAKWAAKLRATMTGGGPVLLHINMDAGHAGAAGRFDHLKEVARAYAFAIACVEGKLRP